jgi:hypothetical protein
MVPRMSANPILMPLPLPAFPTFLPGTAPTTPRIVSVLRLNRHNPGSPAGRRSQHPMISHQIEPRRGNQRSKPPKKIHRVEYHIRCPVPPTILQPVQHPSVRKPRQTFRRHRRPPHIAAQIFQLTPRLPGNTHGAMQAESRQVSATTAGLFHFTFSLKFKPYSFKPLPFS